jgi:hypothetical protein
VGQAQITSVIYIACSYGLKLSQAWINLGKSELIHVGNYNNVEGLARILCCKISSLPMKYLGLPLGASFKAKFIWDGIIEKVERHLAS